MKKGFANSF